MAVTSSTINAETLASLSTQLTHVFKPGFIEVLNSGYGLWSLMPKRKATGSLVEVKFHTTRNTGGGAVAETDTAGTAVAQGYKSGYCDYAIYTKPITVTDFMQAKAMAGGFGNYDAWADEVARAAEDMRFDIESALWAHTSGNACLGIQDWVDDGTPASVMGLTRAGYAFLKAIVIAHNTTLSWALLRQMHRKMRHGTGSAISGSSVSFPAEDQGGGSITHLLCTPEIESCYEALLTKNDQYQIPPTVTSGADPAQDNLVYKRAPVIGSRFAPDTTLFGIDIANWGIEILPQQLVMPDGTRTETDFALIIEGRSGQQVQAFWRIYFQLVCDKPWRNIKATGVSHTEP